MLHLIIAVVKYLSLYTTKLFWDKMTIFIIVIITVSCYLQGNWLYDATFTPVGQDQEIFFMWLHLEQFLIFSFVAGAALFALVSKFKKSVLSIKSSLVETEAHGDFMEYYGFQIDFTNNMAAPAFTGLLLGMTYDMKNYIEITGYLCLVQSLIFYFSLFMTRVSEARSEFYISFMPEACYYTSYISCVLFNIIIIAIDLICYFNHPNELAKPFVIFTVIVQAAIIINFWLFLRPHYAHDYGRSCLDRRSYRVLSERINVRKADPGQGLSERLINHNAQKTLSGLKVDEIALLREWRTTPLEKENFEDEKLQD